MNIVQICSSTVENTVQGAMASGVAWLHGYWSASVSDVSMAVNANEMTLCAADDWTLLRLLLRLQLPHTVLSRLHPPDSVLATRLDPQHRLADLTLACHNGDDFLPYYENICSRHPCIFAW